MKFHPVEVGPFLKEIVDGFKGRFKERNCHVVMSIDDSPTLNIDRRMMDMVINNLISNALRYSPPGKDLKIKIKNNSKRCNISFEDSGFGIDRSDLKKIFRKFYRVQSPDTRNIAGAGLGLFISHEIVKNHKGKLMASSDGRGRGATFLISLPLKFGY